MADEFRTGGPAKHFTPTARRLRFPYSQDSLPRHFVSGDIMMSHFVAVMSATFPEGEDFFVRSVRRYRRDLDNADLQPRVAGFIGQEITHGREHRNVNKVFRRIGYPTHIVDAGSRRVFRLCELAFSPKVCLAMTAAFEHYTATFAQRILTEADAREILDTDEIRYLLLWHAYEEIEHKAVAFDVYRAIGGSERMRTMTMRLIVLPFTMLSALWLAISLACDPAAHNPRRLLASILALRHSPWFDAEVRKSLRAYTTPGFHPDDVDTIELLATWKTALFGPGGSLAGYLR